MLKGTNITFTEVRQQPLPYSISIKQAPEENLENINNHIMPSTLSFFSLKLNMNLELAINRIPEKYVFLKSVKNP